MKKIDWKKLSKSWFVKFFAVLVFLIAFLLNTILNHKNKSNFEEGGYKVTLAELYLVKTSGGKHKSYYTDYVYKVDNVYYKYRVSGIYIDKENKKVPLVFSIENPKLHFIIPNTTLSKNLSLGSIIEDKFDIEEKVNTLSIERKFKKSYSDEKYLKEYFSFKNKK